MRGTLCALLLLLIKWQNGWGVQYVNLSTGNDAWNGQDAVFQGGIIGPKRTIRAAINAAVPGDIVNIQGGFYNERLIINKNLQFILNGNVANFSIRINGIGISLTLIPSGAADFVVRDTINLINGKIEASDINLQFIAGANCRVIGGNRGSFVDGRLIRDNVSTSVSNLYFPIGTGPDFRPVSLSFSQNVATSTLYGASVRIGGPLGSLPSNIKNISKVHFWNLQKVSGSGIVSSITARFGYDSTRNDDEVFDPLKLRLMRQSGGIFGHWLNLGGTGTASYTGTIQNTIQLDTLGRFTLGNVIGGKNTLGRKVPLAFFGIRNLCINERIQFSDSSFSAKVPVTRYSWDFGTSATNDTSNQRNPTYLFSSIGPFQVRFIAFNVHGSDTFYRNLLLLQKPSVSFNLFNTCLTRPSNFNHTSTVVFPDTIKKTTWNLGNSQTRSTKSFSYTYPIEGIYTVLLEIESSNGCKDTLSKKIEIYKKPNVNYNVSNICLGDTTKFAGFGGNLGDTIQFWQWKINGTVEGIKKNLNKVFSSNATYSVSLNINTQNGCRDTVNKNVTIFGKPVVKFWLDPNTLGNDSIQCRKNNRFTFVESTFLPQGQGANSVYYFNGRAGSNPYQGRSGVFTVKLVSTTNNGCKDSTTSNYRIKDTINVNFGAATYCLPTPVTFTDSSSALPALISNIDWQFGDGNLGNGKSVNHAYANGGNYNVKVVISTNDNCKDSLSKTVRVTAKPSINILKTGNNPFCDGDSLVAIVVGGSRVLWSDGDTNRRRVFRTGAFFRVQTLNSSFCFNQDSITVQKHPKVIADAGKDTAIIRGRFYTLFGSGGEKYQWEPRNLCEFPDSFRTRTKPLAKQEYFLTVTDANGCIGKDTVTVDLKEPPFVRIPNLITPNGDFKNETWDLREVPEIESCTIKIFSRNGQLYKTIKNNYLHNWDGTNDKGEKLPNGGYLYEIKCPNEKDTYKGYVHIMR